MSLLLCSLRSQQRDENPDGVRLKAELNIRKPSGTNEPSVVYLTRSRIFDSVDRNDPPFGG